MIQLIIINRKCEYKGEVAENRDKILEKMRLIVNQITDPKILDAMPPEIRYLIDITT